MRPTLPRISIALLAAALAGYVFVIAPHIASPSPRATGVVEARTATPGPSTSPKAHGVFPPLGKAFIGIATPQGVYDFSPVDRFAYAAGRPPQVMLFNQGWALNRFDRGVFDSVAERGMLPMLAWEPWDYRVSGPARHEGAQPAYRLSRIIKGDFDAYVRSWAEGIMSLNYPVAIRFAHEMNGFWYPWCESSNNNRPGDYVKAWRHIRTLFQDTGVRNVIWVWSPNVAYEGSTRLAGLYPGDAYVDWIGLSGYYGIGRSEPYRPFQKIFGTTMKELRTFTKKPIVVTETAATDSGGRKAEWIRELFRVLPRYPDIIGFIWYEAVQQWDWRIVSSPAVTAAFATGAAQPRYDLVWSPDLVPRTKV